MLYKQVGKSMYRFHGTGDPFLGYLPDDAIR